MLSRVDAVSITDSLTFRGGKTNLSIENTVMLQLEVLKAKKKKDV